MTPFFPNENVKLYLELPNGERMISRKKYIDFL